MTTNNRMECVLGRDRCAPTSLAQTVHCVSRHSDIGTDVLAEECMTTRDDFVKRTSDSGPCRMPLAWVTPVTRRTGRDDILRALANESGYDLIPRPSSNPRSGSINTEAMAVVAAAGRLFAELNRLAANGGLSPEDRRALRMNQIAALRREIDGLDAVLAIEDDTRVVIDRRFERRG